MGREYINLIGNKYGKLTVTEFVGYNKGKERLWKCQCDCGNTTQLTTSRIDRVNGTKSCGCLKKTHFVDLTGQKFNHLTILKLTGKNKHNCFMYDAVCECGKIINCEGNDIKSGRIKSCGCTRFSTYHERYIKEDPDRAKINGKFAAYKNAALKRGYIFELTREEFGKLVKQNCYYCNIEPQHTNMYVRRFREIPFYMNGIDRVDNQKGYTTENTVTCCTICNQAKHQLTKEKFLEWAERLSNYQKSLK